MKKILPISIMMIAIVVCSMSCSSDKGKKVKRDKNGRRHVKSGSLEAPYKSAKYRGLDTDGGEFISFVDGNSVYVAKPDGTNVTKIFEAAFPKGTYFNYIGTQNGNDYIEILQSYHSTNDFEDGSGVVNFYIVNIHNAKITEHVKGPGIDERNKHYPFGGVFIPGTNMIIFNKSFLEKPQIYDVDNKKTTTISGCHQTGLFSHDNKWCYFSENCAKKTYMQIIVMKNT